MSSQRIILSSKNFITRLINLNRPMAPFQIVMVRHGESEWNEKNLFCGWYDAKLSNKGKGEAAAAGKSLKDAGYSFDIAYTSFLSRAQETLQIILDGIGQTDIEVVKTWRLNERHYGALTGLNKAETAKKYGEEQVTIWRRSFDVPPPPMEPSHPYYKEITENPLYATELSPEDFPNCESLKLTIDRALPFWNKNIVPKIKEGKKVLIAAHGNSLRGIVKHLDQLDSERIMALNLPTGIPFVYTLNEQLKPIPGKSLQFLGDAETVKKAMEAVAAQGKAK